MRSGTSYYVFDVCFLLPFSGIVLSNGKGTYIRYFPCCYGKYGKKSSWWEEGFILAHSSRVYCMVMAGSPVGGKGGVRETNAGAQFPFSFLFSHRSQTTDWCHPHLLWVGLPRLPHLANPIEKWPYLFPWWLKTHQVYSVRHHNTIVNIVRYSLNLVRMLTNIPRSIKNYFHLF